MRNLKIFLFSLLLLITLQSCANTSPVVITACQYAQHICRYATAICALTPPTTKPQPTSSSIPALLDSIDTSTKLYRESLK